MYVNVIKHLNMKYYDEHTYSPAVGCWPKLPSFAYLRKPPSACGGARGSRWVLWSCARAHNRYLNASNYRRTAGKADVVSQQTSSQMCATPHSCLIITSVQRWKVQLERFWRNKESRAAIKWHSTEREVYASKFPRLINSSLMRRVAKMKSATRWWWWGGGADLPWDCCSPLQRADGARRTPKVGKDAEVTLSCSSWGLSTY